MEEQTPPNTNRKEIKRRGVWLVVVIVLISLIIYLSYEFIFKKDEEQSKGTEISTQLVELEDTDYNMITSKLSSKETENLEEESLCDIDKGEYNFKAIELRVYDSQGRITGLINGETKTEISSSVYFSGYAFQTEEGEKVSPQEVIIMDPKDTYLHEIFSVIKGNYNFNPASTTNKKEINFVANNIPISPNVTHQYHFDWEALAEGKEGVTILIDNDNDGVFEKEITSDAEITCEEFLLLIK